MSRLLSIAAQFSTRLVRRYAVAGARLRSRSTPRNSTFSSSFKSLQRQSASKFPNGVAELSRFIVVIRTLQEHLQAKRKGRSRSFKVINAHLLKLPLLNAWFLHFVIAVRFVVS